MLFFKQKTAYDMRISDWSSDVCSSDLKLAKLADTAFRNLDELNALVFEPDGYERVMHPKLPDSLSSMSMLSKEERAELREKRERFNPYLTFDQTIELRKRNIFIGFSAAFIRLSSYFKYNNDTARKSVV